MTKRYELTDAAQQVMALEAVIQDMDAELARLRAALRTIAGSPDSAAVLRHIAKLAVEGGRQ